MTIKQNSVVNIHYTLTDDAGETLDSSIGHEPLQYLQGAKNIIPGLEDELMGKAVGDELKVTVQPENGYGEIIEQLVQEVPRSAFADVEEEIKPGMQFQADTPNGPIPVIVIEANEETIKLDGNHPLAGKVLNFDVKVESVRDASEEELKHGHVHGADGHQH